MVGTGILVLVCNVQFPIDISIDKNAGRCVFRQCACHAAIELNERLRSRNVTRVVKCIGARCVITTRHSRQGNFVV